MKIILKTMTIIAIALLTFSCDQNDDVSTPENKFTVAGIDYETTNCYVEFDEDDQNEFNLFFLNGRMIDATDHNLDGEYLFSTNATNFVFYNIRDDENPSINNPFYPNIQSSQQYIGGASDTVIISDGGIESPVITLNGVDYGEGDDTLGTNLSNISTPTITINSWNFDNTTQTGTINVDYVWGPVSGHYEGTIGVFED